MAASKQASKHTHARGQCSNASVGLAQARPNYHFIGLCHGEWVWLSKHGTVKKYLETVDPQEFLAIH